MDNDKDTKLKVQSLTRKQQFTILKRLMHFAKYFRKQFAIAVVFAVFLSIINVILPRMLQYYMDHFLNKQSTGIQIVLAFAAVYFIGTIIKAIVQFIQNFAFSMGAERTLEKIRSELFHKLHTLGMDYFDKTPAGSIVSRVTNDTKTLYDFWSLFLTILVAAFAMISAFIAMYTVNPILAWATAAFILVLYFVVWLYQHLSSRIYQRLREYLSQINTKLNESLMGISIIQQFGQQKRMISEFEKKNNAYFGMRNKMINVNSFLLYPTITLMFTLAELISLSGFGIQSTHTIVAAGVIYAFISYQQNFFNPLSDVMNYMSYFQDGLVAGYRIMNLFDNETTTPKQNEDSQATVVDGKIEFKHVTFAYVPGQPILKDISFTVEPGQTVALVGHTGSGKSSIINILLRFYEFGEGQILLDDHDIRDYSTKELRQKLGLVVQEPYLFYGDIAKNIRMFDDSISDEQVEQAAKFVDADPFIQQLPGKYHAKVIERGSSFSTGQRQLISFARTIVRNPKVLILDEATANIDPQTEQTITRGLSKMRSDRTTIAIAHRLSTIQDADKILVLSNGRIVERGTHSELLAAGGLYSELYELQSMDE
ncbi:ABC transporter ATP-binding protein [Companilactobacillus sp.]|jgi:ATP-binding cassette subfamily B protein|uniref:ABC transporter ATP-binding protein n=1 Tax=Companilactobacillus sp. TaxID=2767905 RepID=UPI0025B7AA9E|nr:ABC transporter ATP-binding protein [Companilactobacillus sp.]MCH4009233.1 ABC transporter ATP-binding protein/permease [Companilactobacillus sp.]MCH4050588.1 ABC transporter ATP-binding protein/permease [Companilactobacillus sp.]MCH4077175.1 ABC transporter ATP-binding protein/permease [Companilactobacillus sp.]MCH4125751.1 ABC transporter ATP-binding protein/permease [Companilactobacillus sp.]MCI1311460.1 ABC transporter ATP-binding protein/permease [Companilactobacillus sp.]